MTTRLRCKTVMEGPGPHETIVAFGRTDGREEEVVVPKDMVAGGRLSVGRIADRDDAVLIELPLESASGNWRVLVKSESLK
jgi:hypothetical protein